MKKTIILLSFLLLVGVAEAANISLTITWQASSSVVRPGGDMTLYLTLTNPGLDLNGVVVTATPGPHLKMTSGNKIELGDMPALTSQQSSISVNVDESAGSTISYVLIEARYYYANSEYKRTIYIPVTIRRDPVLEITNVVFNDTAEPGKTIKLSFEVYNRGDAAARDLVVKLNRSDLFIIPSSSGESIVSELDPSEYANLEFLMTIDPEADIGIENVPVILSYYDDTKVNNYTEIKNIGLEISGYADFIVFVDSYNNFYYGRTGNVVIDIVNKGSAPANYISVEAESDFGSNGFYIGNLDPDDSETIELSQDLAGASGKYPVSVTLNYRDKFGNIYSFEKDIEVTPSSAPLDFTLLIVIAVVLVIGYWLFKRRKKK